MPPGQAASAAGYGAAPPGYPSPPPGYGYPQVPGGAGYSASPVPGVQQTFDRLLADIKSFDFRWVVPMDTATSPQMLKNPAICVMLLLGFFPLGMLHLNLTENVGLFLTLFTAYYCFWWAGYYFWFVCQRSVNFWNGVGAMAFTAFIGCPVLMMLQKFGPITWLYSFTNAEDVVSRLIGFIFAVGTFEELTKAAPVLLLAYSLNKLEKPIDGIFYGAMSGLGFAIAEGVMYLARSQGNIVTVLIRTTTLPFMHSLWAATVGYFIALALINRRRGVALVVLGVAVCAVHHGVYDTFSSNLLGLVLAAFLYLLFAAYMARSQVMVAELQEAERRGVEETRVQWMVNDTIGRWRQAQGLPPLPASGGIAGPGAGGGPGASAPPASQGAWGVPGMPPSPGAQGPAPWSPPAQNPQQWPSAPPPPGWPPPGS